MNTTNGPTARLAALAAGDFPAAHTPAARHAARRHLMDTTGAIVAGIREPFAERTTALHAALLAPGPVRVPGSTRGWDALSAAYLMGSAGHGLELDDGYTQGSVHPGVTVVPALLAAAQLRPATGSKLLTAVAVGYELVALLSRGVHPASRRRGFHNTAIVGPLAAAAAVGALFGLDATTIEHAMGLAASGSGGLFAFLHGGGDTKRLHAGRAAREGLLAALMAEGGLHGPRGVLESRDGFIQAFGDPASSRLLKSDDVDATAAVTHCYIKPWACCRHIHPALDGLFDIRHSAGIGAGDVARIEVDTYAIAAMHAGTGWGDLHEAQMSYPFVLSVAMARGHADLDDFGDSARADPAVTALCSRVVVRTDAQYDADYPSTRMARIRMHTTDGRMHERVVDDGYGAPSHPIDDAALARKFDGLVTPVTGLAAARTLRTTFQSLESAPNLDELIAQFVIHD